MTPSPRVITSRLSQYSGACNQSVRTMRADQVLDEPPLRCDVGLRLVGQVLGRWKWWWRPGCRIGFRLTFGLDRLARLDDPLPKGVHVADWNRLVGEIALTPGHLVDDVTDFRLDLFGLGLIHLVWPPNR